MKFERKIESKQYGRFYNEKYYINTFRIAKQNIKCSETRKKLRVAHYRIKDLQKNTFDYLHQQEDVDQEYKDKLNEFENLYKYMEATLRPYLEYFECSEDYPEPQEKRFEFN